MANVLTELPKKTGERDLATLLAAIPDDRLHLWFGLEYIPWVNDIDILLWHEDAGVFVIEVKAIPASAIEEFGWEKLKIRPRRPGEATRVDRAPQLQAGTARDWLLTFLRNAGIGELYLSATCCWPLISRSEWNDSFEEERICGQFAESMLFQDDMQTGRPALVERLQHIRRNPPSKRGTLLPFHHDGALLTQVSDALHVQARMKPAPSDMDRLRTIERECMEVAIGEAPVGERSRVLYSGRAGTGKTFRLLEIGMAHALAGEKVLFTCFNKVLASDITRMIKHSRHLKTARGEFVVADIYALLREYAADYGYKHGERDVNEWGKTVAADMLEMPDAIADYDTVLIDEAQDMQGWMLDFLEGHCPEGTMCVANGSDQTLYGQPSDWLARYSGSCLSVPLRRNFRNTRPVFQLAQVFLEAALDVGKIAGAARRFKGKTKSGEQMLLFDRNSGQGTQLQYLPDDMQVPDVESGVIQAEYRHDHMVSHYTKIVQYQLNQLQERDRPLDLLILVPSDRCEEYFWVLGALAAVDCKFIDYVKDKNRRTVASPSQVRLCTFHSARGLEGMRVVTFGMSGIENLCRGLPAELGHLGYIVLSRSLFECTIVASARDSTSDALVFIEEAMKRLR